MHETDQSVDIAITFRITSCYGDYVDRKSTTKQKETVEAFLV